MLCLLYVESRHSIAPDELPLWVDLSHLEFGNWKTALAQSRRSAIDCYPPDTGRLGNKVAQLGAIAIR
jgi:hypothetical protein